jgi:hypothetical protein
MLSSHNMICAAQRLESGTNEAPRKQIRIEHLDVPLNKSLGAHREVFDNNDYSQKLGLYPLLSKK